MQFVVAERISRAGYRLPVKSIAGSEGLCTSGDGWQSICSGALRALEHDEYAAPIEHTCN